MYFSSSTKSRIVWEIILIKLWFNLLHFPFRYITKSMLSNSCSIPKPICRIPNYMCLVALSPIPGWLIKNWACTLQNHLAAPYPGTAPYPRRLRYSIRGSGPWAGHQGLLHPFHATFMPVMLKQLRYLGYAALRQVQSRSRWCGLRSHGWISHNVGNYQGCDSIECCGSAEGYLLWRSHCFCTTPSSVCFTCRHRRWSSTTPQPQEMSGSLITGGREASTRRARFVPSGKRGAYYGVEVLVQISLREVGASNEEGRCSYWC